MLTALVHFIRSKQLVGSTIEQKSLFDGFMSIEHSDVEVKHS